MSQLARIGEALDEVERLHGLRLRGAFDIDLEEVMQEDKVKVGSSLVKCCGGSKEELAKLLSGFLLDYGQRHTISVQDILAEFALSTISNDFGTWLCDQDNLLVANWQDTISMVLQFMKEHPGLATNSIFFVNFLKSRIDVKKCVFNNQGLRQLLLTVSSDLRA